MGQTGGTTSLVHRGAVSLYGADRLSGGGPAPGNRTPFIYRLDVQAALQRGLYFVIIVDSLFLVPDSLRQSLSSLLLHHSARFPCPMSLRQIRTSFRQIPDS